MSDHFNRPFRLDRWLFVRGAPGAHPAEDHARHRSIEHRLSHEAALARRDPSPALRWRTLNAIYDIEFHRRYRRTAWWRTTRGGSALVAASVLIAGALFGLMTFDSPSTRRGLGSNLAHEALNRPSTLVETPAAPDVSRPLEFVEDSIELAALAAPEWVLRALAPPSIRSELGAMADGARRAADYLVSRLAADPNEERSVPAPPFSQLPASPLSDR